MIFILLGILFLYGAYQAYKHIPSKIVAVGVAGVMALIGLGLIL